MKKNILLLIAFVAIAATSLAQNNIKLKIHHKLGEHAFGFNENMTNNLEDDFNITRMQYYISEIAVIYDQGTETYIQDVWVLADASAPLEIDLGNHNINEVEGISFAIGVDQHNNHADPATFDANHPLAPQSPSMHWGWTSGYRFAVLEGNGGPNYDQTIELHGLGDPNYFRQTVLYPATAQDNEIVVHIDADYSRALENISVAQGVVVHGNFGKSKQMIENFRDYVFSPTTEIVSTVDFTEVSSFDVFPNPSQNKTTSFKVNATKEANYKVVVSDILGKQIQVFEKLSSNTTLETKLEKSGLYFISLSKEGQNIITKKLIVN